MKFLITIDTEADNQWDHGRELTVENIKYVPRFQELCEKYDIKPTYLVTSEICEDEYSQKLFSKYIKDEKAEIGAHLHSWTTPPFQDKDGYRFNDPNHAFATEFPQEIIDQKLKNLTNQIEQSFGKRPFSFRSGRFGFDERVARILINNGYLVDSSVTPYTDWSVNKGMPDGKGGPDFSNYKSFPFSYRFDSKTLLEIPVTIIPTKFPLNSNEKIALEYFKRVNNNIVLRGFRKLFFQNQPLWLRPYSYMTSGHFEEVINECIRIKLPFLVMMFHSSELMPGCSKYRKDKESVEKLFELLEQLFVFIVNKQISAVSLTEAAKVEEHESLLLG
jgi:hypothetical protein